MTTEKLTMKTTNMADENFRKLQELFPEAVTEIEENGKIVRAIDKDKLQQLISTSVVEGSKERYQFTWPGKRDAVLLANTPTNKTLRPVKGENKTDDACFNSTENLYIEGDNLEVLKLLQEKYLGKIKMIYIDPPYNTGNDFIYKDNFAQNAQDYVANSGQTDEEGNRLVKNVESNGRFHSDWLSMMYPRLKIARNLLADDGVIFISIDDNEQENLKKLCDEIFGETSFVATFPWRKRTAKSDVPFGISQDYEFIHVYAKSDLFCAGIEGGNRKYYETPDFPGRPWRTHDMTCQRTASERPNSFFTMINPKTGEKFECDPNRVWRLTKDTFQKYYEANEIVFPGDYSFLRISKPVARYFKDKDMQKAGEKFGKIAVSTKLPDDIGMSQDGTKEMKNTFECIPFPFPKSYKLIEFFIKVSTEEDELVLDFFSGSATTAHAVMQLNAEDGGNRKFIMVQLPEVCDEKSEAYKAGYNTICDIGKERIRRAGAKIKEELEKTNPERAKILDTGFRVLRLDSSNMKDVFYRPVDLKRDNLLDYTANVKEDRNEMDLLFQIMPELNADYTSKIEETYEDGKKIFNVESNYIVACFAEDISEKVIRKVASYKPDYAVFRDSCFPKDSDLANVEQIFRAESPETRLRIL